MHYYQFNIGDYHTHTDHLSEMEDLAYRRMLDWCYLHEKELPLDCEQIARLIRMRSHTDCIAIVIEEFFVHLDLNSCKMKVRQKENDEDTTLIFESRFETGNLRKALKVGEFEYELFLKNDYGT